MIQFWDSQSVASRYFAIHANNFDPRFFDAKKIIKHSSGVYFSITQATASYVVDGTCDIVLCADTFISESTLHDVLVDAGATDCSIDTPPRDSPRRWLNNKMMAIWDAVAKTKLRYFCTGNQHDAAHVSARHAAESFVIQNASSLPTMDDAFTSKLSCIALDGDHVTMYTQENYMGYPPECQYEAYQLWMQDTWRFECPFDVVLIN